MKKPKSQGSPLSLLLSLLLTPILLGAQAPPPQAAGYTLAFGDEFSGTSIDTSKWDLEWSFGGQANNTYPTDYGTPANITVANGSALLKITKGGAPSGYTYSSAVMSSKFAQQYGYWEASIKVSSVSGAGAKGIWNAFWLVANNTGSYPPTVTQPWPPEIDISEWWGVDPTADNNTNWGGSGSNPSSTVGIYNGPDLSLAYHIYGMLWTSKTISYYFDNALVFSTPASTVSPLTKMQIILNNDVCAPGRCEWVFSNSATTGDVSSSTMFPNTMAVDYVHVFTGGTGP